MSDYLYTNLGLHVRHIPEPDVPQFRDLDHAKLHGYDTLNPVTGRIQVGVILDGHFLPLLERKAPGVLSDVERAKKSAASQPEPASE